MKSSHRQLWSYVFLVSCTPLAINPAFTRSDGLGGLLAISPAAIVVNVFSLLWAALLFLTSLGVFFLKSLYDEAFGGSIVRTVCFYFGAVCLAAFSICLLLAATSGIVAALRTARKTVRLRASGIARSAYVCANILSILVCSVEIIKDTSYAVAFVKAPPSLPSQFLYGPTAFLRQLPLVSLVLDILWSFATIAFVRFVTSLHHSLYFVLCAGGGGWERSSAKRLHELQLFEDPDLPSNSIPLLLNTVQQSESKDADAGP